MTVHPQHAGSVLKIPGYQFGPRIQAGDVLTANGFLFVVLDDPRPFLDHVLLGCIGTGQRLLPCSHEWVDDSVQTSPAHAPSHPSPQPEYEQRRTCLRCPATQP